ncbi:(2Fe-2S)-binding protein [Hoeflea sp. G2-23]|uniref:(2Fe-2S)-binding protein n=1 Tax=Hoeflea algicola TaxID=2983763 RepID=A0ABT3ZDP8_9HYPH|nr:(2Fe-2S)-binding protein [Hoeflea algicola]MCY0149893.1 (2Fe-2S)-binding protein [Hoeflea algicola]
MIICSCNIITKTDIEEAVTGFLDCDPWQLITPGKVFHAMQKRGKCCGCFPGVIDIIVETTERYHAAMNSPQAQVIDLLSRIADQRLRMNAARQAGAVRKQSSAAA